MITILVAILWPIIQVYAWLMFVRIMHELARCTVARLGGLVPNVVYLGVGQPLLRHPLGTAEVVWSWAPFSSRTELLYRPDRPRLGIHLLAILAGVFTDFLLLWVLTTNFADHELFASGNLFTTSPWELAFPFHLIVAVANLIPVGTIPTPCEWVPASNTDGQMLLALWRWKANDGDRKAIQSYCESIQRYDPCFQWEDAQAATDLSPARRRLQRKTDLALMEQRFDDGYQWAKQLLDQHSFAPGERALVLDRIASLPVFHEAPAQVTPALEFARQAHALFPESATVRGTLGALLVLAEKPGEGLLLLEPLTHEGNAPLDRLIAAAFMALGHHQLVDPLESRYWLTVARECLAAVETADPDPFARHLLERTAITVDPSSVPPQAPHQAEAGS